MLAVQEAVDQAVVFTMESHMPFYRISIKASNFLDNKGSYY